MSDTDNDEEEKKQCSKCHRWKTLDHYVSLLKDDFEETKLCFKCRKIRIAEKKCKHGMRKKKCFACFKEDEK